jgi:hypothetical protein
MEDELVPLVVERLACNITPLYNSIVNILTESRHTVRKLYSNACNELTSIAYISSTFCEEEASPKPPILKVSLGNGVGNG